MSGATMGGLEPGGQSFLHAFIEPVIARYPDRLAIDVPPSPIRSERQTMTYRDLNQVSEGLALQIAPLVDGEAIFALMVPRTTPMLYAAQLAILRAGGAYTCLDPSFPDERIVEILEDARPAAVLAIGEHRDRLANLGLGDLPLLDLEELTANRGTCGYLPSDVRPDCLAYVIYTSGTTGRPKGVEIEHRNISNLVGSDIAEFGLGPSDRVVQSSSSAYDSSIEETWLAFATGATLVVMDDAAARLGPDLVGWLKDEQVTVFCPPPTLLRSSGCADPARALPDLRLLYVGGEALPADIADRWSHGRRMVNGYGPTECAVTCLRGDVLPGRDVGIGHPVPGMKAWVLDENLVECAVGERGELCIGGAGVGLTRLGRNTFLGNHVVVPPGEHLPDNILVGIATRADATEIASGEARFGHPSFDLPKREVVSADRSLTHDPSPIRYWNRVFWELLRFTLPVLPMVLTALWYMILVDEQAEVSPLNYDLLVVPSAALFPLVALCASVLALKWALIGRVKPGQHPLWSCWCSRWDFVYVAWARWAARILRRLDGTFALPVYLRAMGLKIGKRAVLGPQFAQVVDPDMIEIGDGATVSSMFQAHTFEDRVLKVDKVKIGAGATLGRATVPLYGATIGEGTHVGAHSVIMKREHLLAGRRYQGVPTRVFGLETPPAFDSAEPSI